MCLLLLVEFLPLCSCSNARKPSEPLICILSTLGQMLGTHTCRNFPSSAQQPLIMTKSPTCVHGVGLSLTSAQSYQAHDQYVHTTVICSAQMLRSTSLQHRVRAADETIPGAL